ncbi:hypothetical protein B0H14DRAFT_2620834 [Mycena olivaceomarginata]|nr:hypothetical protein B0H14DRAFT_2620834 [Mycena olivaceomarginata]
MYSKEIKRVSSRMTLEAEPDEGLTGPEDLLEVQMSNEWDMEDTIKLTTHRVRRFSAIVAMCASRRDKGSCAICLHGGEDLQSKGSWCLGIARGDPRLHTLNNAHHGVRLGQALFKIIRRLKLEGRLGYVTCDNASNNGTMLVELARLLLAATGQVWDPIERRINKSPHFSAHDPDAHVPVTNAAPGSSQDDFGLDRAIAVKERSSAKRKQLFQSIQLRNREDPAQIAKQTVLDMKVRWSSTFSMLKGGYQLRKADRGEYHLFPLRAAVGVGAMATEALNGPRSRRRMRLGQRFCTCHARWNLDIASRFCTPVFVTAPASRDSEMEESSGDSAGTRRTEQDMAARQGEVDFGPGLKQEVYRTGFLPLATGSSGRSFPRIDHEGKKDQCKGTTGTSRQQFGRLAFGIEFAKSCLRKSRFNKDSK